MDWYGNPEDVIQPGSAWNKSIPLHFFSLLLNMGCETGQMMPVELRLLSPDLHMRAASLDFSALRRSQQEEFIVAQSRALHQCNHFCLPDGMVFLVLLLQAVLRVLLTH